MANKVTLATIAKACHLSVGTVSRALNNRSDISQETKRLVAQAAKDLGYQKSTAITTPALRIGIVYCREQVDFYNEVTAGILTAQKEHPSITVDLLQTQQLDSLEQARLLYRLPAEDYDALVINSAGVETGNLINRFSDLGIPVSTFNTDAPNSRRLFFVGSNAYTAGQMGAHLLGKLVGGRGKVLLFGSLLGQTAWVDRLSSAFSVLCQDFPNIEAVPVLREDLPQWDILQRMQAQLSSQDEIAGIFSVNNAMTCDILQALREQNRRDICLVGFDINPATKSGVLDGYCDALLFQSPFTQGYLGVTTMVDYLTSGQLPSPDDISITPNIVMKYNLESYGNLLR